MEYLVNGPIESGSQLYPWSSRFRREQAASTLNQLRILTIYAISTAGLASSSRSEKCTGFGSAKLSEPPAVAGGLNAEAKPLKLFTGTAGVSPAASAKREPDVGDWRPVARSVAPGGARCGRDACGPSEELE